jgi:hypothetical protein
VWLQPPEPEHDPEEVRQLADEILSRPRYDEGSDSWLERFVEAINDLLDNLFGSGDASQGGGDLPPIVSWLVLAVFLALVVGLLVWAVRSGGWGRRRTATEEPVILSPEEQRSADAWLAEAERHEAEGRWREGLLCRYRSLVTELVRAEVVSDVAGRTAGEYVREVSTGRPAVAGSFAAATELFEAAWYGGVETGEAERDRFVALAADTVARMREREPAGT